MTNDHASSYHDDDGPATLAARWGTIAASRYTPEEADARLRVYAAKWRRDQLLDQLYDASDCIDTAAIVEAEQAVTLAEAHLVWVRSLAE